MLWNTIWIQNNNPVISPRWNDYKRAIHLRARPAWMCDVRRHEQLVHKTIYFFSLEGRINKASRRATRWKASTFYKLLFYLDHSKIGAGLRINIKLKFSSIRPRFRYVGFVPESLSSTTLSLDNCHPNSCLFVYSSRNFSSTIAW